MRKHNLIADCETMSDKASECAVIDYAFLYFDSDRFTSSEPYTFRSLFEQVQHFKLNVQEQVDTYGFTVTADTVKFWAKQAPEVVERIKPSSDDLDLEVFMDDVIGYLSGLPKIDTSWARATNFDATILERIASKTGRSSDLNEYLMHWRWRDVRTYIDAVLDWPKVNGFVPLKDEDFFNKVFKQHDCRYDVVADVLRLQAIERSKNDMEITSR